MRIIAFEVTEAATGEGSLAISRDMILLYLITNCQVPGC